MAETEVNKHVTGEALKAVLQVVKTNIDIIAQGKVDSLGLKTINGQDIKGSGDISINLSLFKIVETLPATDIELNKIYVVKNQAVATLTAPLMPDVETNIDNSFNISTSNNDVFSPNDVISLPYVKANHGRDFLVLRVIKVDATNGVQVVPVNAIYDDEEWSFEPMLSGCEIIRDASGQSSYTEYMYIDGRWEKIGDCSAIDLTPYITKAEVNGALMSAEDGTALANEVFN